MSYFLRISALDHKDDIAGLALLLGHSSLDTTMLYDKPSLMQLSQRIEQLTSNAYQ